MTALANRRLSMAGPLVQWFIYCLIVGLFAAYVAGRALGPGAHYLSVFRFVGCVAFLGHGMALLQNSIWYRRKWSTTLKSVIDALVYGLVTAGVFGWLWPSQAASFEGQMSRARPDGRALREPDRMSASLQATQARLAAAEKEGQALE